MITLAHSFLIGSPSFLQVTRTAIKARMSSKFGEIRPRTVELAALERLEKFPYTYNGRNVVTTLASSFLAHQSRRLRRELKGKDSSRHPSGCHCVCVHTIKHEYL